MVQFCDLPLEILLDITERATEPAPTTPTTKDSHQTGAAQRNRIICPVRSLALVCRYLNGVTARKLFRTYRLQLREKRKKESEAGPHHPTCFLTGRSLLELRSDGTDVEARLAHLRTKAAFVREIRIVDYGQSQSEWAVHPPSSNAGGAHPKEEDGEDGAPFDLRVALVSALVNTLDALDGVTSVVFESTDVFRPAVRLPDGFWQWLARRRPGKVSFDGYFAFPDSLGWLPPVGSMSLVMNEEASRILEVVRPAHLNIRVDTADRSVNSFKEIFEPHPALERLDVRFQYYDDGLPPGYFDFTAHPEMRLSIHMAVSDKDVYIEDPGAWEETEESLKETFVDDFTKLDVRRDVASDTFVISRPPRGEKGGLRVLHLPKGEDVGEEETVLAFEQAVLAALSAESAAAADSDHPAGRPGRLVAATGTGNGGGGSRPIIDAAFWTDLDGVFATVYSQTFEALAQSA